MHATNRISVHLLVLHIHKSHHTNTDIFKCNTSMVHDITFLLSSRTTVKHSLYIVLAVFVFSATWSLNILLQPLALCIPDSFKLSF